MQIIGIFCVISTVLCWQYSALIGTNTSLLACFILEISLTVIKLFNVCQYFVIVGCDSSASDIFMAVELFVCFSLIINVIVIIVVVVIIILVYFINVCTIYGENITSKSENVTLRTHFKSEYNVKRRG